MVRTQRELGGLTPRLSLWVTGMRENLPELPGVIDLAARIGVSEVYLQRLVFGFGRGEEAYELLARSEESIYDSAYRDQAEAFIAEAERRAERAWSQIPRSWCAKPAREYCRAPHDRGAMARLQPSAPTCIYHRAGHGTPMLHRSLHRRSVREHYARQLHLAEGGGGSMERGCLSLVSRPSLLL